MSEIISSDRPELPRAYIDKEGREWVACEKSDCWDNPPYPEGFWKTHVDHYHLGTDIDKEKLGANNE